MLKFDLKYLDYLKPVGLLVLMFYLIYPQALAVRGSSALFATGGAGMLAYIYSNFPYRRQVAYALAGYMLFYFVTWNSSSINNMYDDYIRQFTNTQMGYFFGAFLFNWLFFKVHKKPSFNLILKYVALAIALQAALTILMYFNPEVNDYLYNLQLKTEMTDEDRARFETERLMGYGTGLFGAGLTYGFGLIITGYLLCREKFDNWIQLGIVGILFSMMFYIGIFSARTTIVGFGMCLGLICFLTFFDKKSDKRQTLRLTVIMSVLLTIGSTLVFIYFDNFTTWAFEMIYNFRHSGKVYTESSSGIMLMFAVPKDLDTLLYGKGSFAFFGSDVGYSRLMFYVGVPGMIIYFLYTLNLIRLSLVKDVAINILLLYLFVYMLIMNIKGFTDINILFCLFFFFFLFYKERVYHPSLERHMREQSLVQQESILSK